MPFREFTPMASHGICEIQIQDRLKRIKPSEKSSMTALWHVRVAQKDITSPRERRPDLSP
jgi:hypothetical protein